jgi:zinc finger protein
MSVVSELKNQKCHLCGENKLILREQDVDIPHFGLTYVLSMECEACGFKKSDIECAEKKEPCKYAFDFESEADLNIKIIKSGEATVKIPHIITIEPGVVSEGYITNIEGLLDRIKKVIESTIDGEEDEEIKNKARNQVKKLGRALVGREKLKIIIEDPSGHSAILSDKAIRSKL